MPDPARTEPGLSQLAPAERHRAIARDFGDVVNATGDWHATAPVAGWTAIDVVAHLVEWFPAFLAGGGVELPVGPTVHSDPVGAWQNQTDAVQALLDDKERAAEQFTHPYAGTHPLGNAIDQFYTADVFMHTWDLARATGVEPNLDRGFCKALVEGMKPMDEILRSSGQYGPAVAIADDVDEMTQLVAFIGRDPSWR